MGANGIVTTAWGLIRILAQTVFDFSLNQKEMEKIQALDEGESLFFSHYDPATVEMITGLHR